MKPNKPQEGEIDTFKNVVDDSVFLEQEYLSSFSEKHSPELEEFYNVWDYVEMHTITEDFWQENYEAIKLMTFDLYRNYAFTVESGVPIDYVKFQGKMLEIIFSTLLRHGLLKSK